MKLDALFFATAASAAACGKRCSTSDKCIRALGEIPEVGEAFCSSLLSLDATTIVAVVETVASINTIIETVTSVETVTVATTTGYAPTVTVFERREEPSETRPSGISSVCGNEARLSSACSCFLSTVSTTTATIYETSTVSDVFETTITTTDVSTASVTAIVLATPTLAIPKNVIPNGAFENYLTNDPPSLLPWVDSIASTGGRLDIISPLSVCSVERDCPGGSVIVRAYPPKTANSFISIKQTFAAKPSTTYAISFLGRCLNYDISSGYQVLYKGSLVSDIRCPDGNFHTLSGGQFTTDVTGVAELEIRFKNGGGLQYVYYYADAFQAVAI